MKKIRTGDQVIVISGKDKGKQGSVTKILSNGRCYVSGVQMVKRHTKPNPNAGVAGGIVEKESSIDISNIAIFNPSTKKQTKFQFSPKKMDQKLEFLNLQVKKYKYDHT